MEELGFMYSWTPDYSPKYNGAEEVIALGKQMIKQRRLVALLKDETENLKEMIEECFKDINIMHICKCVRRSLGLLN